MSDHLCVGDVTQAARWPLSRICIPAVRPFPCEISLAVAETIRWAAPRYLHPAGTGGQGEAAKAQHMHNIMLQRGERD